MVKLTYDEIMSMMREGITNELIEEVIDEMNLNEEILQYPVELAVQRMHLENDLTNLIGDWVDSAIESMTLIQLKVTVEYFRQNQEDINEIRISKPEREEDIKISAKDLWL